MRRDGSSHVRWFLIFWIFVLGAVAYLDRVNVSIAGGSIASLYHFSNVQLGWVFSSFLVGYALFQTIGGRLADRFGPRRILTAGVLWWGVFTALCAVLPAGTPTALLWLILLRLLLGAGEAVMYPASNQFVARWIPIIERGRANGWIFAGVGVGAGLTPPIITYVMTRYGWRTSFFLCAVIGLVAGVVWFWTSRDTPNEHPLVSAPELALINAGLDPAEKLEQESVKPVGWAAVLKSGPIWAMTISYFCYGYVAWIFFSWFYLYLAEVRGLRLKTSARYAMLPFVAMALGCLLGGAISDRLTAWRGPRLGRCILAAVAIAAAGVFLALGASARSAQVASLVLAGGAGALYVSQSSFWSVTADVAGPSSGFVSGFMNMGGQIGGATTASLTPLIALHFGWTASFLTAAALCVLGSAAWMCVDPTRKLTNTIPTVPDRAVRSPATTAPS